MKFAIKKKASGRRGKMNDRGSGTRFSKKSTSLAFSKIKSMQSERESHEDSVEYFLSVWFGILFIAGILYLLCKLNIFCIADRFRNFDIHKRPKGLHGTMFNVNKRTYNATPIIYKAGDGLELVSNEIFKLQTIPGVAGTYGDSTHIPVIEVDNYGRVISVTLVPVAAGGGYSGPATTDDLPEGVHSLYYTDARVYNAISAQSPILFDSSTGVISLASAGITHEYIANNNVYPVHLFANNTPQDGWILRYVASTQSFEWVAPSTLGSETITTITNTVPGHKIADYTNEQGTVTSINETITSLSLSGSTLTYIDETGASTNIDLPAQHTLWDNDTDTGINVEANPDEDYIRFYTYGNQRSAIDNHGNWIISSYNPGDFTNPGTFSGIFFNWGKNALRVGFADNNEWDDINVGRGTFANGRNNTVSGNYSAALGGDNTIDDVYSVALGRNLEVHSSYTIAGGYYNTASGYASAVFGQNNTVSGRRAMAWGMNNQASADEATAFGYHTTAAGTRSLAFGRNAIAAGAYGTAFGSDTRALGDYSTAFGQATVANANYATAWGRNAEARGYGSTAFGYYTTASGQYSLAGGYFSEASGNDSVAFNDTVANSYMMTAVGRFNVVDNSQTPDSWVDTDYLFVVGNGTGWQSANRHNAFSIYKNGRLEIDAPVDEALLSNHPTGGVPLAIATVGYVNSHVGTSIFDADADTGIQVEANPDEDYIRMQTAGVERVIIDNVGNMGVGLGGQSLNSLLQVGPGTSEASTFAVNADPNYMNIATFRDQDGENVFRAMGSLANDDLIVTFGDWDWAYDHLSFGINSMTDSLEFYGGDFRLYEFVGGQFDYVGFRAPNDVTSSVVWTLPAADGGNGYLLQTDGSGHLSWVDPGTFTNIYTSDGTLQGDREVNTGGYSFAIYGDKPSFDLNEYTVSLDFYDTATDSEAMLGLASGFSTLQYDPSGPGMQALTFDGTDMIVRDDLNYKGLVYEGDYEVNFVARSLVTKQYVDNAIASNAVNIYTTNGSLADERTVDLNGHNLLFTGSGNVGIGTATPGSLLEVNGGDLQTLDGNIITNNALVARGIGTNGEVAHLVIDAQASTLHRLIDARNNNGVQFVVSGNNRVGIGVSNPGAPLHIRNTQTNTGAVIMLQNTNGDYSSIFEVASNPEGNITAFRGDLAIDGLNGDIYIKNSDDNANTGWVKLLEEGDTLENIYNTNGSLLSERNVDLNGNNLLFTGAGNVGIGTTNPVNKLQVVGNVRATRFLAANGTQGSPAFRFDSDSNTGMFLPAADTLAFTTNGAERYRINQDGLLTYGTTVTDYNLAYFGTQHSVVMINQDPGSMATYGSVRYGDDDEPGRIAFLKARGGEGSEAALQDNDKIAEFSSAGYDGSQYITTGGIRIVADGSVSANNLPTRLEFLVNNGGGNLGADVEMTLDHNGNLGIGTATPAYKLDVNGNANILGDIHIHAGLYDSTNSQGSLGQVLTVGSGGAILWQNPVSCVIGGAKVQANGTVTNSYGNIASVTHTNTGRYRINFANSLNTDDYYVHLTKMESTSTRDDVNIDVSAYNTDYVDIIIHEGDNGTSANVYRDRDFGVTIFDANCVALSNAGTPSDARLKTNIETINNPLSLIEKLRGVRYNWNTQKYPNRKDFDTKPEIGLIAQEVKEVVPEVVEVGDDGYYRIEYGKMVGLLVEGIKSQQNEIIDLQHKTTVNSKFNGIVSKLFGIEKQLEDLRAQYDKNEETKPLPTSTPTPTPTVSSVPQQDNTDSKVKPLSKFINGIWNIVSEVIFKAKVIFKQTVAFMSKVRFAKRVEFADKDMAGYAIVKAGDLSVHIEFEEPYKAEPVVSVAPVGQNVAFYIDNITSEGFDIVLTTKNGDDVKFTWMALNVDKPRIVESKGVKPFVTPSPSPTSTNVPTSTPTVTPTPTLTITPTPSAVPTLTPTPTLTPSN